MMIDEFSDLIRDEIFLQCNGCLFIDDCRIKHAFEDKELVYEKFHFCPCSSCIVKMNCSDDENCPYFKDYIGITRL